MTTNTQTEAFGVFAAARPVNKIQPQLPAHAMKTYGIAAPLATHFREATCEEVLCEHHINGWRSVFSTKTDLGTRQIRYVRDHSGRTFTMTGPDKAGDVTFIFPPGQKCFAKHSVSREREPVFYVVEGDWRGNPRDIPARRHTASSWLDDFGTHQGTLADRLARG